MQRLLGDGPATQQVADRIDAFLRAHYMRDLTVPALAQEIEQKIREAVGIAGGMPQAAEAAEGD